MTREELYAHGLITILAEGSVHAAELIEGRPLPDLVALAGNDERLREWVEKHPSAREHENFAEVFRIFSEWPELRWSFLMRRGVCDFFNWTEGFPGWHRLTLERLGSRGRRRGLRVTVRAIEPEAVGAEAVKRSGGPSWEILAGLLGTTAIQLTARSAPSWVTGVLLLLIVSVLAAKLVLDQRGVELPDEEPKRKRALAFRDFLYEGREAEEGLAAGSPWPSPGHVDGVLVESSLEITSRVLAAYFDGATARLYSDGEMFSIRPDFTDPLQAELFRPVVAASQALVSVAEPFLRDLPREGKLPPPKPGRTRVVLLTSGGIHAVEESGSSVEIGESRFLPIHQAAEALDRAITRSLDLHTASFFLRDKPLPEASA